MDIDMHGLQHPHVRCCYFLFCCCCCCCCCRKHRSKGTNNTEKKVDNVETQTSIILSEPTPTPVSKEPQVEPDDKPLVKTPIVKVGREEDPIIVKGSSQHRLKKGQINVDVSYLLDNAANRKCNVVGSPVEDQEDRASPAVMRRSKREASRKTITSKDGSPSGVGSVFLSRKEAASGSQKVIMSKDSFPSGVARDYSIRKEASSDSLMLTTTNAGYPSGVGSGYSIRTESASDSQKMITSKDCFPSGVVSVRSMRRKAATDSQKVITSKDCFPSGAGSDYSTRKEAASNTLLMISSKDRIPSGVGNICSIQKQDVSDSRKMITSNDGSPSGVGYVCSDKEAASDSRKMRPLKGVVCPPQGYICPIQKGGASDSRKGNSYGQGQFNRQPGDKGRPIPSCKNEIPPGYKPRERIVTSTCQECVPAQSDTEIGQCPSSNNSQWSVMPKNRVQPVDDYDSNTPTTPASSDEVPVRSKVREQPVDESYNAQPEPDSEYNPMGKHVEFNEFSEEKPKKPKNQNCPLWPGQTCHEPGTPITVTYVDRKKEVVRKKPTKCTRLVTKTEGLGVLYTSKSPCKPCTDYSSAYRDTGAGTH